MTIHELFSADHVKLRQRVQDVQAALTHPEKLEDVFLALQKETRAHFRKEDEIYYPHVDAGKQVTDRELMHTLRNDHAAVVFALESLAIRLRKKVPLAEWKAKFEIMISVLLPHFDHEEKSLFPEVERILPPAELKMILDKVQAME